MATLLIAAAGAAIGGSVAGSLGIAAATAAQIGGTIGALAGSIVDRALINALAPRQHVEGQRLSDYYVTGASEGAAVKQLWGRQRLDGNVIWSTEYKETVTVTKSHQGSGKGFSSGPTVETTNYLYSVSFAVAFCEGGDGTRLGRVWADSKELDMSGVTHRFYSGSDGQSPDPKIEATEGDGLVPAFRGIAYLVLEDFDLTSFGNHMPQISAEILRRPPISDANDLVNVLKGVTLLPGSGEFLLGTQEYKAQLGVGQTTSENRQTTYGPVNLPLSLDQLQGALPNCGTVLLVVSWFGTDLRAGECQVVPKVELRNKTVTPTDWSVAGQTRADAALVSQLDNSIFDPDSLFPSSGTSPAFGGTPSDQTVIEAIQAIRNRGLRCIFYPFVMMDIPPGNGLPNPYGGGEQAAFPWRGRITCDPAPGQPGSPDKTSTAGTQVNAFFDQYDAMVAHYIDICATAGGVEGFVIGSELVGLTTIRSSGGAGTYPAVERLKLLAAAAKTGLPGTAIGYAADWTEFHSHRPADGSNDVIFNMDTLWSDTHIDFIGIDNYLPLSDWRDTGSNVDSDPVNGPFCPHDRSYLQANIEGGEDFDWYYANFGDRVNQTRTPILDTAYGEDWVFRQKDLRSWWENAHHHRPAGIRSGSATGWSAQSKPIWFTEFGSPGIDKGPNQPNVFFDPKSSESFLPYFSSGSKDDAIQRAYIEATVSYWRDHTPVAPGGLKMLDPANMFAWAWDARPYPDFPGKASIWRDGPNYELGHWLTGRAEQIPLKWIVAELCARADLVDFDTSLLMGPASQVIGYATDNLSSPRDILANLMDACQFDCVESNGKLVFYSRFLTKVVAIEAEDLAIDGSSPLGYTLTRGQETDLPGALNLTYLDPYRDYSTGSVEAAKPIGNSQNISGTQVPVVLDPSYAISLAQSLLQQVWLGRDSADLQLPPSKLLLDAGDGLSLSINGFTLPLRIKSLSSGLTRVASCMGFDPSQLTVTMPPIPRPSPAAPHTFGASLVEFMDIPIKTGDEPRPWAPRIAAYQQPWGGVNIFRQVGGGYVFATQVIGPSVFGATAADFYAGPADRWDEGNALYVQFYSDIDLISLDDTAVLGGANAVAVKNASGQWEIVQFGRADLLATNKYKLTHLLRGQLGSEGAMASPVATGARVIYLDTAALAVLDMSTDQRNIVQHLRYGPAVYTVDDRSFQEGDFVFTGVGLRPYSVTAIQGARALPANDVAFTWLRRTRFGGDVWDAPDVPLNEDYEAYDIEVMNGASVVRTIRTMSPAWTYAAADQVADFGSAQASYTLRIYQISAAYGRGQVAQKQVFL